MLCALADADVHVIVLSGAGGAFCSGYDLKLWAETPGPNAGQQVGGIRGIKCQCRSTEARAVLGQRMPWDPIKDYVYMNANTQHFMSLWQSPKPVICKVHGYGAW